MNKNTFVKRVVVAGGFLFLFAAPSLSLGQSSQPGAALATGMKSASARPSTSPPDFLAGLTLTSDQQARIDQIREDTKSRLAVVTSDKKMSPEVTDAMLQGFLRIENSKIFEVLTPEQQREVRRRVADWRAAARQHQHQLQQPPGPERTPQPK